MIRTLITLLTILTSTYSLSADVKEYKELKVKSVDDVEFYLTVLVHGFTWSNGALKDEGRKPLYCLPPEMSFSGQEYIQLLDSVIESTKRNVDNMPIEYLLLMGLKVKFPCDE